MPADDLQVGMRVIADVPYVGEPVSDYGGPITPRNARRTMIQSCPGTIVRIEDCNGVENVVHVMLTHEGIVVALRRDQVRRVTDGDAVQGDVIDDVRSAVDPAIAAQQLDARLARQAKATGELGHIAEQTRLAAAADVDRINLIRRRLRVIFPDLPDLDGTGPVPGSFGGPLREGEGPQPLGPGR